MKIEGTAHNLCEFLQHIDSLQWSDWRPKEIVVHHCYLPSLAQRPNGFTRQHMKNIQSYYEELGWSAGPHLFIDESKIWTFSPMTSPGVHARTFNSSSIGVEMLGNYDLEDPWSGRGLKVLTTTCRAVRCLVARLQLTTGCIRFHRDDPKTKKSCPGTKITKEAFLAHLATV